MWWGKVERKREGINFSFYAVLFMSSVYTF